MKIGFDLRTLMDSRYSGVSSFSYNLLNSVLKLDSSNKYSGFLNSFGDVKLPKIDPRVSIIKTNYPNKYLNYLSFKYFNTPKIDKLLNSDLYYLPHINFVSLSKDVYKVITVHDLSFFRYKRFFSLRKNLWHYFINVKKLLNEFDLIIAVSENTKRDIVELCGINESKIRVIYSALDLVYFQENSLDIKKVIKKYSLPTKIIFSLSTIEPRKNFDSLLIAFDQLLEENQSLRDYHLIIAGSKGWSYNNVFRIFKKMKHKKNVRFLDYIKIEEKRAIYSLSKLFVFPSFYEGFGFPPLEAMISGTPVLASDNSSIKEILGSSALLFNPYNIGELKQGIESFIKDESLRDLYVKRGKLKANNYRWEKTAQEYIDLFNNRQ